MTMAINPVSISTNALDALANAAAARTQAPAATPASSPSTPSFDQLLTSLTQSQNDSDALVQGVATGSDSASLDQMMIGLEENDVNFRVTMAIRDKLVSAYEEVMKMQI